MNGQSAEFAKLVLFLGAYVAYVMTPGPRTLALTNCAMLNGSAHAFTMVLGLVARRRSARSRSVPPDRSLRSYRHGSSM